MPSERSKTAVAQSRLARKKLIVAALCLGLVAGATWSVVHAQEQPGGAGGAVKDAAAATVVVLPGSNS